VAAETGDQLRVEHSTFGGRERKFVRPNSNKKRVDVLICELFPLWACLFATIYSIALSASVATSAVLAKQSFLAVVTSIRNILSWNRYFPCARYPSSPQWCNDRWAEFASTNRLCLDSVSSSVGNMHSSRSSSAVTVCGVPTVVIIGWAGAVLRTDGTELRCFTTGDLADGSQCCWPLRGDGRHLPFADATFDAAWALFVLHHVAVAEP
jgi:Methyltransferase domain